ncbi:MAG TPA: 50S ribosomal protein L4 [Candidatus Binatus sp.]|jgi:large subunit ribosomal protein L4|nr:50S ribosomal protein L4 [Candidatus Binatus sp.]
MAEQRITLPVVSQGGSKVGDVEVPALVLAGPPREALLHEVVRSQLASRRAGTAATKTRGFVSGGGKKPWRQKGTGRARAGSSRSPVWAGGGTIFGPQPRSYAYRLPRTARRAALRAAVADRHSTGKLLVVDGLQLPEAKTKRMIECLHGLGLDGQSVLIVLARPDDAIQRAARNLPRVKVLLAGGLNVYDVLGHAALLMTRQALDQVVARLGDDAEARA